MLALAQAAGHSDGRTYADCVACGQPATFGAPATDAARFELGHDVADQHGGVFCVCNFLAMCRTCNDALGDRTATETFVPVYDARSAWDGTLVADPGTLGTGSREGRGPGAWQRI